MDVTGIFSSVVRIGSIQVSAFVGFGSCFIDRRSPEGLKSPVSGQAFSVSAQLAATFFQRGTLA